MANIDNENKSSTVSESTEPRVETIQAEAEQNQGISADNSSSDGAQPNSTSIDSPAATPSAPVSSSGAISDAELVGERENAAKSTGAEGYIPVSTSTGRPTLVQLGGTSSTTAPTPQQKRFSAVNINKKFLEKNSSTSSGSAPSTTGSTTAKSGGPSCAQFFFAS